MGILGINICNINSCSNVFAMCIDYKFKFKLIYVNPLFCYKKLFFYSEKSI